MVEIDIDLIVAYNLTIEEYVLLDLLRHKHYGQIRKYFNDKERLHSLLQRLILLGHLSFNELGNIDTLGDYNIKFFPRYKEDNNSKFLEELMNIYPVKVKRTNGNVDYLKANHKLIKEQYKKIIKGSKSTHDHILSCLKYQIDHMTKTGQLQYLRKLTNWLEREEWREWEDRVLNNVSNDTYNKEVHNIYGNLL